MKIEAATEMRIGEAFMYLNYVADKNAMDAKRLKSKR